MVIEKGSNKDRKLLNYTNNKLKCVEYFLVSNRERARESNKGRSEKRNPSE